MPAMKPQQQQNDYYQVTSNDKLPKIVEEPDRRPTTQLERWWDDTTAALWVNIIRPTIGNLFVDLVNNLAGNIASSMFGTNPNVRSYSSYNRRIDYSGSVNNNNRPSDYLRRNGNKNPNDIYTEFENNQGKVTKLVGDEWRGAIRFRKQSDATTHLENMRDMIEKNGYVTVAQYIDGAPGVYLFDYVLNDWGWTDLSQAYVDYNVVYDGFFSRDGRGYEIALPPEEDIKRYKRKGDLV